MVAGWVPLPRPLVKWLHAGRDLPSVQRLSVNLATDSDQFPIRPFTGISDWGELIEIGERHPPPQLAKSSSCPFPAIFPALASPRAVPVFLQRTVKPPTLNPESN